MFVLALLAAITARAEPNSSHSGSRSTEAQRFLQAQGFTRVYNL